MSSCSSKIKNLHTIHPPDPASRQADKNMRKYQQLALIIVSFVCIIAFMFYKHEYERLRYTLEYLDTFGEAPSEIDIGRPQCGYNTHHKITTPPADWIQVTFDLQVYSAYWDDGNGFGEPQVRAIAVVRKSTAAPSDLGSLIWFESEGEPVQGMCNVEYASERDHGHEAHREDTVVLYLLCSAHNKKLMLSKTPYMIQFIVGNSDVSKPVFIHESTSLKSVINKSAVCILPVEKPSTTLKIIEFISFYNIIGIDKFSIYGPVLTPLARKLLDKYSDEIGLEYEEKQFSSSNGFKLTKPVVKKAIELDCLYRHRDTHENVLILDLDQYVILQHKSTIQETLMILAGSKSLSHEVAEFHLSSQLVCLDLDHMKKGTLLMSQQIHKDGIAKEMGVAILRPHLVTVTLLGRSRNSAAKSQHVSSATAIVHHYSMCSKTDDHQDQEHLPSTNWIIDKIKKSLLYRKWVINQ